MRKHPLVRVRHALLISCIAGLGLAAPAVGDSFGQGTCPIAPGSSYIAPGAILPPPVHFTAFADESLTPSPYEFADTEREAASNFSATANWGDGSTSPAPVTGEGGCYTILAPTHTYGTPATYSFSLTLHDARTGLDHVVDERPLYILSRLPSPLTMSRRTILTTLGSKWHGVVGEFTGQRWFSISAYTAVIEWGDGSRSQATIQPAATYPDFSVVGSHT